MTDELKKRLDALREIAPRLNRATDQATTLVKKVEKILVDELGIGIAADACFEVTEETRHEDDLEFSVRKNRSIAFGRVDGRFQIHVLEEHMETHGGDRFLRDHESTTYREETAWGSCDRETKLRAFQKLPKLLDEIHGQAEGLAVAAEEAAVKVKEMAEGLDD